MTQEENLRRKQGRQTGNNNWKKRDIKNIQGIKRGKGNGQKKRKIFIDVEVIKTDGMHPCRIEHTSSSWSQEII